MKKINVLHLALMTTFIINSINLEAMQNVMEPNSQIKQPQEITIKSKEPKDRLEKLKTLLKEYKKEAATISAILIVLISGGLYYKFGMKKKKKSDTGSSKKKKDVKGKEPVSKLSDDDLELVNELKKYKKDELKNLYERIVIGSPDLTLKHKDYSHKNIKRIVEEAMDLSANEAAKLEEEIQEGITKILLQSQNKNPPLKINPDVEINP